MARATWISAGAGAVRAAGRLRAVLICALAVSMLVAAVPTHAGHGLSQADAHALMTLDGPDQPDGVDQGTEFDCSVHPGCYALALVNPAKLPVVNLASAVYPEHRRYLPGVLPPPLPHPPNLS